MINLDKILSLGLKATEMSILLCIVSEAKNEDGKLIFDTGYSKIKEKIGVCSQTITHCINKLTEMGLMEMLKNRNGRGGKPAIYSISESFFS